MHADLAATEDTKQCWIARAGRRRGWNSTAAAVRRGPGAPPRRARPLRLRPTAGRKLGFSDGAAGPRSQTRAFHV